MIAGSLCVYMDVEHMGTVSFFFLENVNLFFSFSDRSGQAAMFCGF